MTEKRESRKLAFEPKREADDGGLCVEWGTELGTVARITISGCPDRIDLNGGADETRTRDLLRDRQAF